MDLCMIAKVSRTFVTANPLFMGDKVQAISNLTKLLDFSAFSKDCCKSCMLLSGDIYVYYAASIY